MLQEKKCVEIRIERYVKHVTEFLICALYFINILINIKYFSCQIADKFNISFD